MLISIILTVYLWIQVCTNSMLITKGCLEVVYEVELLVSMHTIKIDNKKRIKYWILKTSLCSYISPPVVSQFCASSIQNPNNMLLQDASQVS